MISRELADAAPEARPRQRTPIKEVHPSLERLTNAVGVESVTRPESDRADGQIGTSERDALHIQGCYMPAAMTAACVFCAQRL